MSTAKRALYVPPKPEVFKYSEDGLDVTLKIARANGESGTYRTLLMEQAKEQEAGNEPGTDLRKLGNYLTHLFVYPALIAAVVDAQGFGSWPLSFEDYLQLPEGFLMAWENKVWELNPHWRPRPPEEEKQSEADRKKAPGSAQE